MARNSCAALLPLCCRASPQCLSSAICLFCSAGLPPPTSSTCLSLSFLLLQRSMPVTRFISCLPWLNLWFMLHLFCPSSWLFYYVALFLPRRVAYPSLPFLPTCCPSCFPTLPSTFVNLPVNYSVHDAWSLPLPSCHLTATRASCSPVCVSSFCLCSLS